MRTVLLIVLVTIVVASPLASQKPRNPGCGQWDRGSLPNWFNAWFHDHPLAKTHAVACYMNPFYLSGDFEGQGARDLAVLVVAKNTGKRGILVVHRPSLTAHVLGAGTPIGVGWDDFLWTRYWRVETAVPKGLITRDPLPQLRGEVLSLGQEGAGVWLGWDGQRYVLVQAAGD